MENLLNALTFVIIVCVPVLVMALVQRIITKE